jgi:threonine aldolase
MPGPFDFRSDTLTKPTPAMRQAMAHAEVGDDVFDEDPTVHRLQERTADLLGKEAALWVASGTMSNQIALRTHCQPGDEILCEANCHINCYEQGGAAQLAGAAIRPLEGVDGVLRAAQFVDTIRPDDEHYVRSRLVCLENTHNRGAGRIQPLDDVQAICQWAHDHGLSTHLDGARLMNAVVATGTAARIWAEPFDSVSICFSKGLGAPVGSALAGPRDFIRAARRHRKVFGGGMRQAGVVAAAALHALDHHVERLAEDHANATTLGEAIDAIDGLTLAPAEVQTNIVTFDVAPKLGRANALVGHLRARGVFMLAIAPARIRAVTHLDVTAADVVRAGEILAETVQLVASGQAGETPDGPWCG